MSLMNYLGAVASAAIEAASSAAIQQQQGMTATNAAGTASVSRGEGPATAIVSTTPLAGNTDPSSGGRASVTVPQGLPGFPVVPITIHHSSGPSGQFAYTVQAISNGSMRLAHPHVSSTGTQRTFTLPAGMTLAAGQVPGHFSLQTGNSSQPTVEIRLPHPPTLSSQVPQPVGSHLVDKQQRGGVFQMNTASFRGPSIPVSTIPQPARTIQEHEIRREIVQSDLRLKSPPTITNLNNSRPSVLMGPRNNLTHDYMSSRTDPAAVALQDHNYTLPKRLSPIPPQAPPSYVQVPQHHHHHKEPVVAPPLAVPTLPLAHLRAPSPPNSKIHMSQPPPPPLTMHPKPPTVYGNVRVAAPSPPITASEVMMAKGRRPRSESPVTVPGRRRRRKTFEKNKEDGGDIVPERKPGVPGRKRSRKAELQSSLNNTIPPYPTSIQAEQEQLRSSLNFDDEHHTGVNSEPTKRRLKKNKHDLTQLPLQYGRKIRDKLVSPVDEPRQNEKPTSNFTTPADEAHTQNDPVNRISWDSKLTTASVLASPRESTPPSSLWMKQPTPVNNVLIKDLPSSSDSNSNNTHSKTTPPEDSNNEGITRCICDYLHDDGFMICCDKCSMWQHVDCMGIDRSDIPEAYLCEICSPRWVSKARARAIQTRKKEIMDLAVVEDDSTVGDSDQDAITDKSRAATPAESTPAPGYLLSSPGKSTGKLKRRGRPSLSNGQPFSDSDSEMQSSPLHSPTAKRSRKYSGKRGSNLSSVLDFDSPSKIGSRKRRSSERGPRKYLLGMKETDLDPPKTRRSYTRRNTLSSPLSSPGREDSGKGVEDHKENSLDSTQLEENGKESDERGGGGGTEFKQDEGKNESSGILANSESRRKRKQIFKDIPNGDLSPPHIISPTAPSLNSEKVAKSRSPSFDKTLSINPTNSLSNNISASSSPEPSLGASSSLHINVNLGFNNAYACPYSSSPYLEKYEEAENAVCSYSPELRAKLLKNHGGMLGSSSVPDFTPLADDLSTKRWKLGVTSLEGGKKLKTLLAAVRVEPGQAIIEFIGKFLMHTGFISTNKKVTPGNPNTIAPEPFVFFHQVPKNGMCICIDSRKYGNDARFVRRSCVPNAEIRHMVGKGTIHAYVVATAIIDVDDEVTIPHEFKSVTCNTMNSVVQKYHVLPPPLPCACSDLDTCKAVIHDVVAGGDAVVHKKNGTLVSPSSAPQEMRERKRRMSSRRTSLVEKEDVRVVVEPARSPTLVSPQQQSQPLEVNVSKPSSDIMSPPVEEVQDTASSTKERSDGRTTRARTSAIAAMEETAATPVTSKRKSDATAPPTSSTTTRQRNRSGAEVPSPPIPSVGGSSEQQSAAESHKMTREERKLQSVLKIIEKMESNQKKKENRQNQKKDKTGKEKRSDDRETDQDEDSQSNTSSVNLAPIRFAPMINKKKGRKRGRSSSKSGNKPQMISQRNSGSIADLRSISTESDFNSADESGRAGMSPLQENMGPNFRLPKKKEMMTEWRIGSHASPTLPSQYMRKTNVLTTSGATTPPVQPSTSSLNNFLVLPVANGNLDNASAKKRWLRQAISEETDPSAVPSPNSRPNSPVGVECLAPLKKRRLARASMSSEVSNTPPSTPNNTDAAMDVETTEEAEQNEHVNMVEEEEPASRELPARKWSCSEVSSAEEDMDDLEEEEETPATAVDPADDTLEKCDDVNENFTRSPSPEEKSDKSNCSESLSPNRSTTPRRSRWDQVDAPEPVVNNSNSNSPVKSTADAIVLDYVRNPEQYAKLTGALSSPEKGSSAEKESIKQHDTGENEDHGGSSQYAGDMNRTSCGSSDAGDPSEKHRENVESSPKTSTQVKKKLSMEEYFKRKKEGYFTDDKSTALNNSTGTALNSMTSSESNSSEYLVAPDKDITSSPKADGEPSVRGTLQFSSTPTLAERKREELGKRLSKSFGIRVPDPDTTVQTEKTPTLTSPREPPLDKQKPNGETVPPSYVVRSANVPPPPPPPGGPPPIMGHRLSVPTPAALKQSGMPPLPLHPHQSSHTTTPNGATKSSAAPNGYITSSSQNSSYRHYRGVNGPSSFTNHQHPSGRTPSSSSSGASQGPIIGGVPVGNLIPPPPPPTGGPAFAKRFYNKRFFPS